MLPRKSDLNEFKEQVQKELTGNILPFWMNNVKDEDNGGFCGQIDGRGKVIREAEKGGILNARILWTFSAASNYFGNSEYGKAAAWSKDYIFNHFFDEKYGGTYWKVDSKGIPADTKKQIYSQAFFIYALSEYYRIENDQKSLDAAIQLYHLLEEKSYDRQYNGYLEAYSRDWKLLEDLRLSEKDDNEKKTTNTHLHILEAYTNLYKVWKNDSLKSGLANLTEIFLDKIINPVSHHLMLFFDEKWNNKSDLVSYGHDIEASWLIVEAAEVLEDTVLLEKAKASCILLGMASLEGLQTDGSMIYEKDESKGIYDTDRHWWPQAESVVGLINLYSLTGENKYLAAARKCWDYISDHLVDRSHGEWYWSIKNGKPNLAEDKAGFWKCPYHNSRACLEVLKRV